MRAGVVVVTAILALGSVACVAPPGGGAGPAPRIAVSPESGCDFEAIVLGSLEQCTVTVANAGDAPLEVTAAVDGDDGFDLIGRIANDEVAPGNALDLAVELAAAEPRAYQAVLRFTSNDAARPVIELPLHGIALEPPQCAARMKSVNGVEIAAADVAGAVVGDDVVLTLEESQPATATGSLASFSWSVRQSPGGGPAALDAPDAMETGVAVDVAGDYVVCGAVVDDQGLASHNECCASFKVVGPLALMAQVSSTTAPVRLHVVTPDDAGAFCVADVDDAAIQSARDLASSSGAAPVLGSACVNGHDTHNASGNVVVVIDDVSAAGGPILFALGSDEVVDEAAIRLFTFGREVAEVFGPVDGYRELAVANVVDGAVCIDERSDALDACQ